MTEQNTQLDENKLIAERRSKLQAMRDEVATSGGTAFPNSFRRDSYCGDLQVEYGEKSKEELAESGLVFAVGGRVIRNRGAFMEIQDMSGRIQLYVTKDARPFAKSLDLGDIIGVKGELHKSGKGDLYVQLDEYQLLTKSLRPLPDKYHGLADQELRYRQRYVDLIVNPEVRDIFKIRSKVIDFIRSYLNNADFMEVETPMLQVIPGGATARPFVTHHNALDIDMYLRIAPELYLKRLVVGGFERVYEINRNFRNEGLSTRHNPEFTMLEFYQAYADYNDLMDLTEDMLRKLCESVLGRTDVVNTTRNAEGEVLSEVTYDFAKPFARMTMAESVKHYGSDDAELCEAVDWLVDREKRDAHADLIRQRFYRVLDKHVVKLPIDRNKLGLGKLLTEVFEAIAEEQLIQPTFITDYPAEVSPLARRSDNDAFVTDRFEFFIGGREVANGFSELNDAEDQAERFQAQVVEKDAGDDEAMHFDADYIRALEYGLPPTAGQGIGIDRLVMMLTDSPSIRDVLLFPHMRPE
ncbi:lysine--tRNA ligase [Porticoccus sp. W117]|uniref:lysine--tRNA ligase n=1 Tax=Porticoccus sp. W117 TaxID=3054777 RepID=UPI00259190FB|nr:lysine--tRNA ligase [Porticoccus sp. W117]MDM3869863.1 lysine--tRNA ligase [Porticoccus sp. W117]